MSKIIKLPHLQEVVQDLVNKIKIKFNQMVVSVEFDPDTNIVTVTKDGGATTTFSLDKFIDTWGDLDCVTEYSYANLFDYSNRVDGRKYEENGNITQNDSGTSSVEIEVVGGTEYSIYRQHNDNHIIVFYDAADGFIEANTDYAPAIGIWHRKAVTAPLNAVKMGVNFRRDGVNSPNMMVIKGNVIDTVNEHIPYLDGGRILIGNCATLSFDNSHTTLASSTHASAIKELNTKLNDVVGNSVVTVNSQRPNNQGDVEVNAGHIPYNNNTSNIQATNVQEAIDKLKEEIALLENSNIFIVNDLQDYNNRKDTFNLKSGDLIYFLDSNAVVDFNDQAVNNGGKPVVMIFDENAQGASGNNLRIFSKLDTTINITAKDVSFDKNGTSLTKDNVQEAIVETNSKIITTGTLNGNIIELMQENGGKIDVDVTRLVGINTINSESPDMQGNIMLSVDITSNDTIDFKVNSANFGRLTYITDNQVNEIINLFV